MNIEKSKSMGFCNSGKIDLSGKGGRFAVIGGVVIVFIVSALLTGRYACSSRGRPQERPDEYHIKCTECGEEWTIDKDEYVNGGFSDRERENIGSPCQKCKGEDTAFSMIQCPECGKYYIPARVDPKKIEKGDRKDVCPHCGTGLVEYYSKRAPK